MGGGERKRDCDICRTRGREKERRKDGDKGGKGNDRSDPLLPVFS